MSRYRFQTGIALVEFAIVVPLLTLLLIGIIELGRFTYYSIVVGNAANAGAQYGAQNGSTAADIGPSGGIVTAAKNDGQNNIKNISAIANDVCACWNDGAGTESPAPPTTTQCGQDCTSGIKVTYVQVTTSGLYSAMFNYPLLPSTFSVSATAYMRVRQ